MKGFSLVKRGVFMLLAGAVLIFSACDDGGKSGGGGGDNGSPLFVAVGYNGLIYTTVDGTSWTNHSKTTSNFWSVIHGDKFVAVGNGGIIVSLHSNGNFYWLI